MVACIAHGIRTVLHLSDYTEQETVQTVSLWDGEVSWQEDWKGGELPPLVELSGQEELRFNQHTEAVFWIDANLFRLRPDYMFKVGDRVEVFKGRKVPKGIYIVLAKNEKTPWGPIVNLRTLEGDTYNYISAGNCRRVIENDVYDGHFLAIRDLESHKKGEKGTHLQILADAMQDDEHQLADAVRAIGRRLVKEEEELVASWGE